MSNPFETIDSRLSAIESKLSSFISMPLIEAQEDIIGVKEVAKILHLAEKTVYTKTSKKLIPHKKVGGIVLFSRKSILEWINQSEVKMAQDDFDEVEDFISKKLQKNKLKAV